MPTFTRIRSALEAGGVPELYRRTRAWSTRSRPSPAAPAAPLPVTAQEVDHATALAWFEDRRTGYERLARAVQPYLDPEGTVFDVGANIGYFTRVLAEQTGFHGTAHLFEPVPNLAGMCTRTLAGLPVEVHVHPFGLGASEETLDLFIGADGNLGWNTVVAPKASAGMARLPVQVRRFDGTGITAVPGFVKIDVEGAEHLVLRGLLPALTAWPVKPVILCEIGWGTSHPDWAAELAVFAELAALGYRSLDLDGAPLEIATLTRTTDVLLVPA